MNTINWDDSSWKHLSLIGDEEVISFSHAQVYVFSDSVLCLGKLNENPQSNTVWEDKLTWFKSSSQYRALDTIDGEPMEFEWNIFPGITTLQLCKKVQEFLSEMSEESEEFTGRIIFMSRFNDISWGSKDNEKECELSAKLVSICAKRFSSGRWSFLGPGSEKKWYSSHESKPQGEWDSVAELMMLKFGESSTQSSDPQVHCPEVDSKAKVVENCQYTSVPTGRRLKLFFAQLFMLSSSLFTGQSQICVKNAKPAMLEQGDLFWWDNLTHCLCPQV